MSKYMLLLLRFLRFFTFFWKSKKTWLFTFFLLCFTRFLELCLWVTLPQTRMMNLVMGHASRCFLPLDAFGVSMSVHTEWGYDRPRKNGFPLWLSTAWITQYVLPATWHKWTRPALTPGTRITYPGGMEGWVDLSYPAMHRPGTELAISRWSITSDGLTTTLPSHPVPLCRCRDV